jgi:hypothetical protein
MLRIEIRNAIVDDLGVHVVSELYDEYSEMGDNGFIKLKYQEYLREKGCQDEIDAHFKFMNGKR